MFNIPILLVTFNRLDTTKRVFESIKKIQPEKLYVSSDGPRSNKKDEDIKVKEVRDYILASIDWDCTIITLFRDKNLGCKKGVYTAIDWFFEHEEMGIILEDDCLPTPMFFKFCETLLIRYKDDTRVMSISGTNYTNFTINTDYRYSNYTLTWGWATWKRAWKKFDPDIHSVIQFKNNKEINNFFITKEEKKFFEKLFSIVHHGENSIWDAQWFYTCLINGVNILPKENMVQNIGFGPDATHTFNVKDKLNFAEVSQNICKSDFKSPDFFIVNRKDDYKVFKYYFYSSFFNKLRYYTLKFLYKK